VSRNHGERRFLAMQRDEKLLVCYGEKTTFRGERVCSMNILIVPPVTDLTRYYANVIMQRMKELDLVIVKEQLMQPPEAGGQGWTKEECDIVEVRYKKFLTLNVVRPEEHHVPTKAIDKMWHAHILFTKKYREDCIHLFTRFIDHFPAVGGSKSERAVMSQQFKMTCELYRKLFDEEYATTSDKHPNMCSCHGNCKDKDDACASADEHEADSDTEPNEAASCNPYAENHACTKTCRHGFEND
jgi:hypothetical protein